MFVLYEHIWLLKRSGEAFYLEPTFFNRRVIAGSNLDEKFNPFQNDLHNEWIVNLPMFWISISHLIYCDNLVFNGFGDFPYQIGSKLEVWGEESCSLKIFKASQVSHGCHNFLKDILI